MYCPQLIRHTIRAGDTIYRLAGHYQTTVERIFAINPGVDPYNLQIGSQLIICAGEGFQPPEPEPPGCPDPVLRQRLINNMRLAWSQHVYWTRMLLLSIAERLKDLDPVTARLLRNPVAIGTIFAEYYGPDAARTIANLLTAHLQIGAALITALRDGNTAQADALNRQWYQNADSMAAAFSALNPYYDEQTLRNMLYTHLALTTQEVAARLAGNYPADIQAFNAVEREALAMADVFSMGIMEQFPQKFR